MGSSTLASVLYIIRKAVKQHEYISINKIQTEETCNVQDEDPNHTKKNHRRGEEAECTHARVTLQLLFVMNLSTVLKSNRIIKYVPAQVLFCEADISLFQ